jgi:hypothetical protein
MDETGAERNSHDVDVTLIDWFLTLTPPERLDVLRRVLRMTSKPFAS